MSYSKGWSIIHNAEKLLNIKLLQTQIGGADGGGSHLTEDAKKLIKSYRGFTIEAKKALGEIFEKHFGYKTSLCHLWVSNLYIFYKGNPLLIV